MAVGRSLPQVVVGFSSNPPLPCGGGWRVHRDPPPLSRSYPLLLHLLLLLLQASNQVLCLLFHLSQGDLSHQPSDPLLVHLRHLQCPTQANTYTKEALLQLQKNTQTLAPSRPSSAKLAYVLKGLLKPDDDDHPTISQTLKQNDYESQNKREMRCNTQTQFASLSIKKPKDSLIPSQATIDAIRAKQEQLWQSCAAAPDYIFMDLGSNHSKAEGLSSLLPC